MRIEFVRVGDNLLCPGQRFYTGPRSTRTRFVYAGGGVQPDGSVRAVDVRGGARNIRVEHIVTVERL